MFSLALASVAQLIGASSRNQKVAVLIPSQGTYLRSVPSVGASRRQPVDAYLSRGCLALSLPPSPSFFLFLFFFFPFISF